MLTVFIIPTGKECNVPIELLYKMGRCHFVCLDKHVNFNEPCITKWKMFIYEGEVLSKELIEAIPIFLKEDDFDVFKIYKKNDNSFSISPRIFKSEIKLMDDCLLPVKGKYIMETILNGFII